MCRGLPEGVRSPLLRLWGIKRIGAAGVKDQVGDVDATLMFVEGGGTLDAVGNAELATDEAGNGFGLEGPETI